MVLSLVVDHVILDEVARRVNVDGVSPMEFPFSPIMVTSLGWVVSILDGVI